MFHFLQPNLHFPRLSNRCRQNHSNRGQRCVAAGVFNDFRKRPICLLTEFIDFLLSLQILFLSLAPALLGGSPTHLLNLPKFAHQMAHWTWSADDMAQPETGFDTNEAPEAFDCKNERYSTRLTLETGLLAKLREHPPYRVGS